MKTIEYIFIDKSTWPKGEWNDEPDKVQWSDLETGLPCLVVRHSQMGQWCGYVGVTEGHPYYGRGYDEDEIDIQCHGGLTYSDFCREDDKEQGICHLPEPGEPDAVWWFGFDCGHYRDLIPNMRGTTLLESQYRNLAYVQMQCTEIARQLSDAQRHTSD